MEPSATFELHVVIVGCLRSSFMTKYQLLKKYVETRMKVDIR